MNINDVFSEFNAKLAVSVDSQKVYDALHTAAKKMINDAYECGKREAIDKIQWCCCYAGDCTGDINACKKCSFYVVSYEDVIKDD